MSNIYGNQIIPNDVSSLYFSIRLMIVMSCLMKIYEIVCRRRWGINWALCSQQKAGVKGKSLTINKVFRKVATSEGVDYEQVAILDAVTPTFRTNTVNINEELLMLIILHLRVIFQFLQTLLTIRLVFLRPVLVTIRKLALQQSMMLRLIFRYQARPLHL